MKGPNRINPRDVFNNPDSFLDFLTTPNDRDFEGQHFDRKEACRPKAGGQISSSDLKSFKMEQVAKAVSAFANENLDGGLLTLGIESNGNVPGIGHLSEDQINGIGQLDYVVGHNCQFKVHTLSIEGRDVEIALVYVPYASNAICRTAGRRGRAWRRRGPQNIELTDEDLDALRRDKHIVDFEQTHCAKFNAQEVDEGVYKEFAQSYLNSATYDWSQEQLLVRLGAVESGDETWFTNAGKLFFAVNPERDIPQAYIRVVRFDVAYEDRQDRTTPTYDKNFTGPLTKQIRDFRTFIKESAFFETYQRRKESGGFLEEPEYPPIAIDEAVVNAVAHRDYAAKASILCEKYTDAFVVVSPGTMLQQHDLPERFSLEDTNLEHFTRNPKVMEWLRQMKDAQGQAFVQALQEGTRRMRDETAKLGLPAPEYIVTDYNTTLLLRNNAKTRKDAYSQAAPEDSPEYTNLYRLTGMPDTSDRDQAKQLHREILGALRGKLTANGWFPDKFSHGVLIAHRRGAAQPASARVGRVVKLYPSYIFQVREYFGRQYLVVDFTISVQSVLRLSEALEFVQADDFIDMRCMALTAQGWNAGKIAGINADHCEVAFPDYETTDTVPNTNVIPRLPVRRIREVLDLAGLEYDLTKEIRRATFGLEKNASRNRAECTQAVVEDLAENIFPLSLPSVSIAVDTEPLHLASQGDGRSVLRVDALKEPQVEFSKHHSGADVRQGITEYGSYGSDPKDIEIVPLCGAAHSRQMEELINRLRVGKYKYKGSERTFSSKLTYNTIINAAPDALEKEIARLLDHHSDWRGNAALSRIFLVHCPESAAPLDDESAPYYKVKRLLLEAGVPCQMVDTPTLQNPDWKDLNLSLNLVAKCGQTPWVLPQSIPDCDFFVGLSYTQSAREMGSRIMAFANVFNEYGRWEFYSGGSEVFSFEERTRHYEWLVKDTLSKLSLSEEPTICFHYSAKFSFEDRKAILCAARSIRPKGTYLFVCINMHHNLRFYDRRAETDGSMARGRYVISGKRQLYLSTTGHNPYRRTLGTPKALELTAWVESPRKTDAEPDLRIIASQVLSLTKLNWASTDSLCAEPITIKYAGDIAYLTAAFMRQRSMFRLHQVLEKTPWFI